MRKFVKKTRGQILVVAITAMFVLFIFGIGIIEIGNLFYEKTHMQNIADSGAMEAGTWYARALNITSLSNKLLVVAAGVALAMSSITGPLAIKAVGKAITHIQDLQDFFAGTGELGKAQVVPWLCWGSVLLNGKRNDALSLAAFNVETPGKIIPPTFNLKRRTLSDLLDTNQLKTKFYYVEDDSGRKVNVPENEVKTNSACRIYQGGSGKFVIKEQGLTGDSMPDVVRGPIDKILEIAGAVKDAPLIKDMTQKVKFDIVEAGPHTVLVVSYKNEIKQKLWTRFFLDEKGNEIKPFMISSGLVRIDGGSMYFWDMDGASYSPHLDKIQLPNLSGLGSAESMEILNKADGFVKNNQASGGFSGISGYLEKAEKLLTGGVLLH